MDLNRIEVERALARKKEREEALQKEKELDQEEQRENEKRADFEPHTSNEHELAQENLPKEDFPKREESNELSSQKKDGAFESKDIPKKDDPNSNIKDTKDTKDDTTKDIKKDTKEKSTSSKDTTSKPLSDVVFIKDLPRDLLRVARSEFPEARNQTDAVAAFMYVHTESKDVDVPDSVKELVASYDHSSVIQDIYSLLRSIDRRLREVRVQNHEMDLAILFLIFDRLGFRNENPTIPRNVNFLEGDILDLHARLQEQSRIVRQRERMRQVKRPK